MIKKAGGKPPAFLFLSSAVPGLTAADNPNHAFLHHLQKRIQQPGKARVEILPAQGNHILPPLRALPDDAAIAQDAPVVGHRRLGDVFMTQCVTALLAAVGQDANDLQAHRVTKGKKNIFQANVFTFGVIGDHNIRVSAVARRRGVAARIGGWQVIYPN